MSISLPSSGYNAGSTQCSKSRSLIASNHVCPRRVVLGSEPVNELRKGDVERAKGLAGSSVIHTRTRVSSVNDNSATEIGGGKKE